MLFCFYLFRSEREPSSFPTFSFIFFCSCEGRRMWCTRNSQTCSSKSQRSKKWGCLQLYRHSFICMRCPNMPLTAGYIYLYIIFFCKHHDWCQELMYQGCRKRWQVVKALCELEWFMRLCCFRSMRKLDVAYGIPPRCRRTVPPPLRFDAEARSWIYLVDICTGCMTINSEAEPARAAPQGSETAHSSNTAFPNCF